MRQMLGTGSIRAALVLVLAWSAISAGAADPAGRTRGSALRPDLIYHNYCSVCHGDKGDGRSRARGSLNPPPADFTSPQSRKEMTRDRMIAAVAGGRPGTAMTPWTSQLSAQEIEAVVDYIRGTLTAGGKAPAASVSGTSAHGGRERDVAAADMALPFANRLTGNSARGRTFYAANCATCHGPLGDGKGPRAYFINPKPRSFIDEAARRTYNRPALFAAVSMGRAGSEMPAWSKVIDEQQIADVAEYVFRSYIRPPVPK